MVELLLRLIEPDKSRLLPFVDDPHVVLHQLPNREPTASNFKSDVRRFTVHPHRLRHINVTHFCSEPKSAFSIGVRFTSTLESVSSPAIFAMLSSSLSGVFVETFETHTKAIKSALVMFLISLGVSESIPRVFLSCVFKASLIVSAIHILFNMSIKISV